MNPDPLTKRQTPWWVDTILVIAILWIIFDLVYPVIAYEPQPKPGRKYVQVYNGEDDPSYNY